MCGNGDDDDAYQLVWHIQPYRLQPSLLFSWETLKSLTLLHKKKNLFKYRDSRIFECLT
jgi:hypothetical protein